MRYRKDQEFYLKNAAVIDALEWASQTDFDFIGKTPTEIFTEYNKQSKFLKS